jgi:hypothetical protein
MIWAIVPLFFAVNHVRRTCLPQQINYEEMRLFTVHSSIRE